MSAATASPRTNPFPGLRPFRDDEEHLFFGRENQVDAMVDKLAETRFLAVVGTSGSGKSSLVNCGLRPALRRGLMTRAGTAWRMAQFRPGGDPIAAMAHALAQDGVLFAGQPATGLTLAEIVEATLRMSRLGLIDIFEQAALPENVNLLVVVDQFEELFRYRQLEAAGRAWGQHIRDPAAAFVNLLLEVKRQTCPIFVVLTMRSDFFGDCTEFPGLAEAINAGQYLVPRMTRDERRAAIEGPVKVARAEIAPVLLTRLVNDVGDNPDQLSILQHALNRTWVRWQDDGGGRGSLDLAPYEAIGTMARALDLHAEQAYAELGTTRRQQICEKLFKALTDKATDARGIRRPTTLGTLSALADATTAEVTGVIDVFREPSRSFLMPPAGDALKAETPIDISHESLMRVWRRLDRWADEEARSARTYRRLADTADLHAAGTASLWRDPDLQLALDWRDQNEPNETWAARYHAGFAAAMDFLTQSKEAREQERAEREQQRRRELEAERDKAAVQAKHARRMRALAAFSGALAVVAVVLGLQAFRQMTQAKALYRQAHVTNLAFISTQLLIERDPTRALRAAQAAYELSRENAPQSVERALSDGYSYAISNHSAFYQTLLRHDDAVKYVLFSPDGSKLVTASRDGTARLWDRTGKPLKVMKHGEAIEHAAFTHGGKKLITVGEGHLVKMWDADGNFLADLIGHGCSEEYKFCSVHKVAVSPDDKTIVTVSADQNVIMWNSDGKKLKVLNEHASFKGEVVNVAFSFDGKYFATSGWDRDRTVQLYDARGNWIAGLKEDNCTNQPSWNCGIADVAFSADGQFLLTASADATVRMYDLNGRLLNTLKDHKKRVNTVVFSPDGRYFLSASNDQTAILWNKDGSKKTGLVGHTDAVTSAVFSPDGSRIATASKDRTARLWDLAGNLLAKYDGHKADVLSVVFSPDSRYLATASADKTALLWSVSPQYAPALEHGGEVVSAQFLPDGKRILTASNDMSVRLWSTDPIKLLRTYQGFGPDSSPNKNKRIFSLDISPKGERFITTGTDYRIRIWDVETGKVVKEWGDDKNCTDDGWCGATNARYSADGQYIITSDFGGSVEVLDGEGRLIRAIPGSKRGNPDGHLGEVNGIDISRDNRTIVTGSNDKTIKLWEFETGKLVKTFAGHIGAVWSVRFSQEGDMILSASQDQTVKLWDRNGKIMHDIRGHAGEARSAAFSPGMDRIISSSFDKTAKIWNMEGRLVRTINGHEAYVRSAYFSPQGEKVITASGDKTAVVWPSTREIDAWIDKVGMYKLAPEDWRELGVDNMQ